MRIARGVRQRELCANPSRQLHTNVGRARRSSRAIVVEICAASARTDTEGGGGSLKEDEMRTASRLEFDAGPLAMGANGADK